METKPAEDVEGYLLYHPLTKRHFFRVYNPEDKSKFDDYELGAESIKIKILGNRTVLRDRDIGIGLIDFSDDIRHPQQG